MANIEIQRKQSNPIWWILGLILLAALLIWLLFGRGGDGIVAGDVASDTLGVAATEVAVPASGPAANSINEFVTHVNNQGDYADMTRAHTYTATGLRLLAGALDQLATADTSGKMGIDARLETLREKAEALQRDPTSTRHAEMTRDGFMAASEAISEVQRVRFPTAADHAGRVREAANQVSGTTQLLDQKNAVRTFFDRAADALRAMSSAAS